MRDYEKPIAFVNDGESEGVFAASGDGGAVTSDCWTVSAKMVQPDAGDHCVVEVSATHTPKVLHTTNKVEYDLTFTDQVQSAQAENSGDYEVSVSGNKVHVVRNLHANGHNSGDRVTFKVMVYGSNFKTIGVDSKVTYKCHHKVNV